MAGIDTASEGEPTHLIDEKKRDSIGFSCAPTFMRKREAFEVLYATRQDGETGILRICRSIAGCGFALAECPVLQAFVLLRAPRRKRHRADSVDRKEFNFYREQQPPQSFFRVNAKP